MKTSLLEFQKSSFLIDLIKHSKGSLYIKIRQTILSEDKSSVYQEIKINPSILADLLEVLKSYETSLTQIEFTKDRFSEAKKQELINRYFKGVSIKDLALQFDCAVTLVEQILGNKEIPIVENNLPKEINATRRKKRRE